MAPVQNAGPGRSRLFMGDEVLSAYPELRDFITPRSFTMELSNYDIGSDALKPEHRLALFDLGIRAFDKDFSVIHVWGFHSHTGDARFNAALAERRAERAMSNVRVMDVIDARVRSWQYTGVSWRRGMQDGETPQMRKVILVFNVESSFAKVVSHRGRAFRAKAL